MKVLDLFAGLRGWSDPFKDRGHDVRTLEIDPKFQGITYTMDILKFAPKWREILGDWKPGVILASPPCHPFSVMNIGRNWTKDHQPKTTTALYGLELVSETVRLIKEINPKYWVIENPRAKLRKLPIMQEFHRRTVTYCKYGEKRMKPTDIWASNSLDFMELLPPCKQGDKCHISAPRGSRTGTQGMESSVSAKIPSQLAIAVCSACEDAELGIVKDKIEEVPFDATLFQWREDAKE